MTPLVEQRIGATGTDALKRWAFHPQLRIMYVNTFARVGVLASERDDFFDVVRRQRAHRTSPTTPVSDDDIAAVLERRDATRRAPRTGSRGSSSSSATTDAARGHRRPDPARLGERRSRVLRDAGSTPKMLADVDRGATGGVAAAPVLVVVCADTERGLEQTVPSSIFPAVQNLLLAATALGLGSALTTITVGFRAELARAARAAGSRRAGRGGAARAPVQPLGPPRREPFASHTHRERYGHAWE